MQSIELKLLMEGMKLKPSQIYREASNVWRDTEDWSKALGMEVRLITLNFDSCSYSTIGETYLWRKYEWYNLVKTTQGQEQADREVERRKIPARGAPRISHGVGQVPGEF